MLSTGLCRIVIVMTACLLAGASSAAQGRLDASLAAAERDLTWAAGSRTFTDRTGDSGRGADIAQVVVSNDADGRVSLQIGFARLRFDDTFFLCLDTDQSPGTGLQDTRFCPLGADYGLYGHWFDAWEISYFRR